MCSVRNFGEQIFLRGRQFVEKSPWSIFFILSSMLAISAVPVLVTTLSSQMLLPIPSDVRTLIRHEAHQYYTRPTSAGPYSEAVVDIEMQGSWHPQLYAVDHHFQFDNLWCLQVEITATKDNSRIHEITEWIAVKPIHQPWQVFPLEFISASGMWEQRCGK
jgi:hypothetical protein